MKYSYSQLGTGLRSQRLDNGYSDRDSFWDPTGIDSQTRISSIVTIDLDADLQSELPCLDVHPGVDRHLIDSTGTVGSKAGTRNERQRDREYLRIVLRRLTATMLGDTGATLNLNKSRETGELTYVAGSWKTLRRRSERVTVGRDFNWKIECQLLSLSLSLTLVELICPGILLRGISCARALATTAET